MSFPFQVVIPSRYGASRLPGKALLNIGDTTLLQHVYDAARRSQAERVIIATDDARIENLARSFGAEVIMTSIEHRSGTDRISEVINLEKTADDMIIVNVQGDEFALPPALIDQLAKALHDNPDKQMATLCEKITEIEDLSNPNVVKMLNDKNNNAVYFSRSLIPWQEKVGKIEELAGPVYRHIGIYAYRAAFLRQFSELGPCPLEESERLEQLRAIYHGFIIHVEEACAQCGMGIDTVEDLEKARLLCNNT